MPGTDVVHMLMLNKREKTPKYRLLHYISIHLIINELYVVNKGQGLHWQLLITYSSCSTDAFEESNYETHMLLQWFTDDTTGAVQVNYRIYPWWWLKFNTLRPRQNGRHFPDDIFKWIFLNENVWITINISLKLVLRGPIKNIPTLVQVMAWRRPGDKPLSEPMMVRLPTHICVTRPQWVNWITVENEWQCFPVGVFKLQGTNRLSQIISHM